MNTAPHSPEPTATMASLANESLNSPPLDNALLDAKFIALANLTAPLPAQWLYLPPAALYCRAVYQGLWLLGVLIVVGCSAWFWPHSWLLWPAAVIFVTQLLGLVMLPWTVKRQRYVVRQRDVMLCKGLIWQRCTLLPMARLQHVARQQGPLQRCFGLASVTLFSAGSRDAEIELRDIDSSQAEQLTLQLGLLLNKTADAALSGLDTVDSATTPNQPLPSDAHGLSDMRAASSIITRSQP